MPERTAIADHTQYAPDLADHTRHAGLREEFRAAMLRAMGLDDAAFINVARPEVLGPAVAAGKSLEQVKDQGSVLGHQLRQREKEMREALHSAHHTLWVQQSQARGPLDLVTEVMREIEQALPALMLAPRGPYERILWQLVNELEQAAGSDNGLAPDEQDLLDQLRGHAAAIAMVKRDSADSWRRAGQLVFALDDGSQGAHPTNA